MLNWRTATKEELKAEVKLCRKDPCYFIRNYVKIIHQIRGEMLFDLYPFQEKIIHALEENRFNIIRKFRQGGATTIACAYALWVITFLKNKTVPILSIGDTESVETLERVKLMYDCLPTFLKVPMIKKNEHVLSLSNGSKIISRPSKKTSGRSLAGYFLIIDEAAFIESIEHIWASVYPIISTGGRVFIISTVNGVGNWYHNMWDGATREENSFHPIEIHWKEHPEYYYNEVYDWLYKELKEKDPKYDINTWEETTRKNIGQKRWLQEYEMQFLGTGDTYVDGGVLQYLFDNVTDDYNIKYNNRMRVWKAPDPNFEYLISVDTALGRERDSSTFHIINIYNGEQVAEFKSNKTPINEFAEIIATEGRLYNTAYVIPERNTIGNNLIDWLSNAYEYDNIWSDNKGVMGIQLTNKNRESILAEMEECLRTNIIKINSRRTLEELTTFIITNSGKAEADDGKYDDLVMSLAVGAYILNDIREKTPLDFERVIQKEEQPLGFFWEKPSTYNI